MKNLFTNFKKEILRPYKRKDNVLLVLTYVLFIAITVFTVNLLQKEETNIKSNAQAVFAYTLPYGNAVWNVPVAGLPVDPNSTALASSFYNLVKYPFL